jgi:hypothetical protein
MVLVRQTTLTPGATEGPTRSLFHLNCEEEQMTKRLKVATLVIVALIVGLTAAQLIRPDPNLPVDPKHTIQAHLGKSHPLVAVLDRACSDCHSNETRWPSYTHIAPLSWLTAYGVRQGRNAINFSEWGAYSPEVQRAQLIASCEDASSGKMPGGLYTFLRPAAQLSPRDIETICSASRQAQP